MNHVIVYISSLENIQGLEGAIELCKLLQLQLLEVIVIARNIYATLNDGLDLYAYKQLVIVIKIKTHNMYQNKMASHANVGTLIIKYM